MIFETTAAVSICFGSLLYHTIQNNKDIEREIYECGGSTLPEGIMPDWITSRFPAAWIVNPLREIHCVKSKGIRFPIQSQAILHDRYLFTLRNDNEVRVSQNLIKALAKNDHIDRVHLDFTEFNDSQLEVLSASDNIMQLGICGTKCTDAGMKHLRRFQLLESIYLCDLRITDVGAAQIAKCRTLKYVNIYDTSITPAGLEKLFELPNVETLVVMDKKEFKAMLAKWKQKRPKVKVVEIEPANDEEGNPRAKEGLINPRRNRDVVDPVELLRLLRKTQQEGQ